MSLDSGPIVHIASGDLWGGAEAQIHALTVALREQGPRPVEAVLLNDGRLRERLEASGIPVRVFPETELSTLGILLALTRHLRHVRPAIVHTHRQKENVLGAMANTLATRAPCVRTLHGAPEHPPRTLVQRLRAQTETTVTRHLQDAVVAVSQTLLEELSATFGPDRVFLIRNGLDVDALRQRAEAGRRKPGEARNAADDRADVSERPWRIGFFGRLVPVKRPDLLVASFAAFMRTPERNAELHIVGDGPLMEEVKRQRADSGVSERIHVHGHLDAPEGLMATMDCVVLCSDHEGTPMVMLEALALGIPVVAHAIGGPAEVLGAVDSRLLVSDHSAGGYASVLERLSTQPSLVAEVIRKGFEVVERDLHIRQTAKRTLEIYEVLAQRSRT